jgi:putative RNA 2'-phosphotransferase
MTNADLIERITRSLAYMLRHQPEEFDLELDAQGFGEMREVVRALSERLGEDITQEDVESAISSGDRPRYEIAGDKVRALYGHSIDIDPGKPAQPPEVLYVGINSRDAKRAVQYGLRGGRRRFLHLARTIEDARETGRRTGVEYSVLEVHALEAWEEGVDFYDRQALFLAEHIPTEFLSLTETRDDGYEREPRGRERPRGPRHESGERHGERGPRFDRGDRRERGDRGERAGRGRWEEEPARDRGEERQAPAQAREASERRGAGERHRGERGQRRGRPEGRGRRDEPAFDRGPRQERPRGGGERGHRPPQEGHERRSDRGPERSDRREAPPPARAPREDRAPAGAPSGDDPSFGMGVFEHASPRSAPPTPPPPVPPAPRRAPPAEPAREAADGSPGFGAGI